MDSSTEGNECDAGYLVDDRYSVVDAGDVGGQDAEEKAGNDGVGRGVRDEQ